MIQASALPQFYFPRRDDFGIWPIPQDTYTGSMIYRYRDRNLLNADYTGGLVTLTNGSAVAVGSGGAAFTAGMAGRWLTVTDASIPGEGYWLRVNTVTNSTHLTLFQTWPYTTTSAVTYRIGETPEIPEELHVVLGAGVVADYYTFVRKDLQSAVPYENIFWTGDPGNPSRKEGDSTIAGGIIGGVNRYSDRDDSRVINRKPRLNPLQYKVWATTLS